MSQDTTRTEPYFDHGGAPARPEPIRHRPEFHGKAGEYFGIWIVNLVLTILTLGIYSAWAKVRTKRYFYSNTRLAGAPFEYLADPITILKGRLVAYAVLITLTVGLKLQLLYIVIPLYLLLLALFPWLIYLGLRFRARYTSWRGLRFRFDGTVGDAYKNFMLYPFLSLFTLNLLLPWVYRNQQEYSVANHQFGGTRFGFAGKTGDYYRPFLIALGLMIAGGIAMFALIAMATLAQGNGGQAAVGGMAPMVLVMVAAFYAGIFAVSIYVQTRYINLMWNNTSLGEHRFESALRARSMMWLYFSNGVAILCSLGLLLPWATVRLTRYRLSCITLVAAGPLDDFIAQSGENQAAAGAELADALDLDLEIAL